MIRLPHHDRRPHHGSRAGLSLVEVVLVASILGLLAQALVEASTSMGRMTSMGSVQTVLQEGGEKALSTIIADLSKAGYRTVNGKTYPYVFDEGVALAPFAVHAHGPPPREATAGDPDFGILREIVFLLPSDVDGDRRPDMDADLNGIPELDGNGDGVRSEDPSDRIGIWDPAASTIDPETGVLWSHDEISYVVIPHADGTNYLERRVNGDPASARRIAANVERIQFDTPTTSGWGIPLGSVRVQIFFRLRDKAGTVYRHEAEVVLGLRNG